MIDENTAILPNFLVFSPTKFEFGRLCKLFPPRVSCPQREVGAPSTFHSPSMPSWCGQPPPQPAEMQLRFFYPTPRTCHPCPCQLPPRWGGGWMHVLFLCALLNVNLRRKEAGRPNRSVCGGSNPDPSHRRPDRIRVLVFFPDKETYVPHSKESSRVKFFCMFVKKSWIVNPPKRSCDRGGRD